MKFVALAVGVALAASFEGVAAQQPWPVALEGSIGVVKGYTAETDYYDRTPTHIALESLVSARVATWQ